MFKKLDVTEYKQVNKLEYKYLPNAVDIHLVLNGYSQGEVYQDESSDLLVIRGKDTPFAVYTGIVDILNIKKIADILAKYSYCALSLKQSILDANVDSFMWSQQYQTIRRLRFTSMNALVIQRIELLADKFEIAKIDSLDKFEKCYQYKYLLDLYENAENYFYHCHGIGIIDKLTGCMVSETHAFLGNSVAEPTVTTMESYRGLGLSSIANYQLMTVLLDKGYVFEWTCDSDNNGSSSIAHKLGLRQIDSYTMFYKDLR